MVYSHNSSVEITDFIPWAKPDFWGNEHKYVVEALASSWISGGEFVDRLEQQFSDLCDGSKAVAVSNGTSALHLAYLALNIQPGDEIILPGFGFMAAANVALHMNAKPVFCDVDPRTWCVRAIDIESRLSSNTRAIVVVHTYGNVCDMESIMRLANERGIPVIEDAAEAFPCYYRGSMAGSLATIGTFSFQATKTITTGEGGMVVTRDESLYEKMLLLRSHGLKRRKHYWHEIPGLNFRLTNMQAALGCAQLEQIHKIVSERFRVYGDYVVNLAHVPGITLQFFPADVSPVVWATAVKLDPLIFPQGRDAVLNQLLSAGIECRPGFYSPSQLKYFKCSPLYTSDLLASSVISLPSFPTLTTSQIHYVCERLASFANAEQST